MRQLERRQAALCELGVKGKRCRCRCKGELHGAARVSDAFELDYLPWDDPHFPRGGHPQLPFYADPPTIERESDALLV